MFAAYARLDYLKREEHLQTTFEPSYIRQHKQVPIVSPVPGECGEQDWDDQRQCHTANCGAGRLCLAGKSEEDRHS